MKVYALIILLLIAGNISFGNTILQCDELGKDTLSGPSSTFKKMKPVIIPTILMTQGLICMNNKRSDQMNQSIKSFVLPKNNTKYTIDDYTQYMPTAAFLSLDYLGIESKHNMKQKLYAGAISHIVMAATVNLMKSQIHILRPDNSADNSFPSGHTATAFVGAELLWQEYHHQSIWYGIAGYTVASATGFFRMYNNRHWFSDITMGPV